MSGRKKVKNWWIILRRWENILLKRIIRLWDNILLKRIIRRWENILLKRIIRRWENILLKRIIRRFEDFSFRMFWNSRRLLFSKTFYYGIFEDFSFRMFSNIRILLFLNILFLFRTFLSTEQQKILLLATKLTTFPNNHEKQAERCIKIHTLVYRRIRWISQRASSKNALRRFLSYFLLHSLSFSLSLWVLLRSATISN